MKKLVVILSCLLMASSAFAVADADPDGIGIWFDLTADTNYVDAPVYAQVMTYLIISNPTTNSIAGWECSLVFDMVGLSVLGGWMYNGSALNVLTEPDFAVGLAEPLPAEPATLLLSFNLFVMDAAGSCFTVLPSPAPSTPDNLPLYVDGEDLSHLVLLQNATGYGPGGEILTCAAINDQTCDITATESTTWSAVKSLW